MSNITTSSYFTGTGSIGGQAYIDNNNDGIKDNTITSTNAASTITSAVNNLFNDDQLRMISISLYDCKSSSDTEGVKLATSKLSSTGMYSFANLKSGNYYISASLPPANVEDDVMYKFSSVWIRNSSKASSLSIARDASATGGSSGQKENVFNNRDRRRKLGTGGVVNTASDISTINPSTGRTNCFTLQDGERAMSYNFGLYPSSSTADDSIELPPKDAIYYNGFENGDITSDPLWSTSSWYNDSNLVWTVSQDYPNNGRYALQSPVLDTNEMRISKSSNVTLMLPDYYPYNDSETGSVQGGTLYFSVLASVQMPFDIFEYYVDNIKRGQLGQTTASNTYQQEVVKLSPGSHEIKFVYHFNPDDVPANFFPNSSLFDDVRFGLVAIDDLYFVPDWDYIPVQQQPTASPIQLGTKIPTQANTDTSVQPTISSSSPESTPPTPMQDTSSFPSSMPSVQSALVGTNISNIETIMMNDEDTSTDSSNTNIIIGLSCALIAIVLMTVAGLYIGMKRRRRKNDSKIEIGQEEVQVSGDLERGSVNARRRSDELSHCLSVEEAFARKDSYPINSTLRPTTPTSNNSGQVTYYSSGTNNSLPQSQLVPQPIQQALSPVSSYTAGRYDEENLYKLEQEVASLSTAIESVPRDSKTYQVLNLHLERAKEELDAVQQDIEMPSEELDIEEDTTSSSPVLYNTEAILSHAASAAGVEEEPVALEEEDRSGGPSTRSKSPSTAEREHEVWIHCRKEDTSIADSYITFDEQWAMENTKPDPEGITKYVTNPLDAITEYVDDDQGITSEDESSCQRVKEARSIKSKLSLKQLTRFFKKHETS